MRQVLRRNGLALVTLGLFLVFLLVQSVTGSREHNEPRPSVVST